MITIIHQCETIIHLIEPPKCHLGGGRSVGFPLWNISSLPVMVVSSKLIQQFHHVVINNFISDELTVIWARLDSKSWDKDLKTGL